MPSVRSVLLSCLLTALLCASPGLAPAAGQKDGAGSAKAGSAKAGTARADKAKSGKAKADEAKPGSGKTGNDKAGSAAPRADKGGTDKPKTAAAREQNQGKSAPGKNGQAKPAGQKAPRQKVLSLEQAVTMALERNFSVKAAQAGFAGAQSGVQAARSAFGPVLGAGYDYQRRQRGRSPSGSLQDKELFSWRAYLDQNLFAGFATLADYQKAALKEDSARESVRQARLELIRTVQSNFFLYLKAMQDLKSAGDSLERLQSQLASSEAFYEAGVSPRIDVLQAEVDVSTAESALLVAENAVVTQRVRLNTLLLLPIEEDTEYTGALSLIPFKRSLNDCLKQAYVKRPDLIIAEKAVGVAEKDKVLARKDFYPQVHAVGSWGTSGNDPSASGSPHQRTRFSEWSVGVTAEWPVFEWGKTLHESRRAGHEESRIRAEADNLRQEVGFSVTERMLAMSEAAKRIRVAEKAVEQAREAYRMSDARYRQQVGTMTDVLDAQAKLSAAEASLAGAGADYGIALSNLYTAIGEENPGLKPR